MRKGSLTLWGIFGLASFIAISITILFKPTNLHNLAFGLWFLSASVLCFYEEVDDVKNYLNGKSTRFLFASRILGGLMFFLGGIYCVIIFIKGLFI